MKEAEWDDIHWDDIRPVNINGKTYSREEVLQAINYGEPRIFPYLAKRYDDFINKAFRTWDSSLITDLAACLFGEVDGCDLVNRLTLAGKFDSSIKLKKTFGLPHSAEDAKKYTLQESWALWSEIHLLLSAISGRPLKEARMYPHSYWIKRLIEFINFLRGCIKADSKQRSGQLADFFSSKTTTQFWQKSGGKQLFDV
jgi:hypothetical protein